jgi:hypothetical protein
MVDFTDRFGGGFGALPLDQARAALYKRLLVQGAPGTITSPGTTLTSQPVTFPPQSQIPPGVRTAATADQLSPLPSVPPAVPSVAKPAAYPDTGAPAVPYSTPVVDTGPAGVTLASNPVTPTSGWTGSVGMPMTPDAAKAFDKGTDWGKAMSSLDDIAKGFNPKITPAAMPNLVASSQDSTNQPNSLAYDLMNSILSGRKRGVTLAGR